MEKFSLLHPTNSNASYKTLNKEALNDLSVDYICDALTKEQYERNSIKQLLINITDDEEVIKYRCDVFEDFLRFPKLRDDLSALLVKLNDLREIERFQKDTEASSLWQLVNRLREMDGYVDCITRIKNTLETIEVKSQGLLELKKNVQSIYNDSGFPELKKDIIDTLAKAQKLKSITLGVNLDDLLRPKSVGVISLNDKEFTDSGILKRFMKFTNRDSELHHGNDVSGFLSFHPSNPSTSQFGLGQFVVGAQQNVNSPVIVKINIVCDNIQILTVCRFYAEFEVVNISKTAVSVLFRQNFCLAQRKIFLFHLITKLCKANIENDFGHKRNKRVAVDIDISVEH